ncbi:hypothetical protein H257_15988 [Aphanomyces astaci]|uniref:Uncharacterized protein n=1 Tax=Aphanomyces astaci TaxID=112090 RepID=W4FM17_APHAT|nr:hypothetical protein H257_15988 [Aphanomyces astaci]ETV67864.1 hypothetical protein H257_15988 [Aphanomyces astaci]|eukprot:XP_009842609.1 hypothetical protein H257_15988 [Aphanomyces astaci]
MDHSSVGMTPPPTARPRGPAATSGVQNDAATSGVQDDDATTVSSTGDLVTLSEQAATPGSGAHASPYSFLRMHTVLSHGIKSGQRWRRPCPYDMSQARHALVDEMEILTATFTEVNIEVLDLWTALDSSRRALDTAHAERDGTNVLLQEAQELLRTLEQGQHDLGEQREQAQARLNDQQAKLRDLASRLTVQTEKATELGRQVQEADQALEIMTAEVNDPRDYTAHSARLVAGKEGDVKLALQNKLLVVAEMSDLRRSLEAERENSEKARQDRDQALTTAREFQEQLRVAQDRIAQLEAQPLRFSASNPAWDILLAENQDLREAATTSGNKILRSQTETFQADALQELGALESRASHDLEEKLQAFQESERTSARALLNANEHFKTPSQAWTLSDPDRFKSCNESVGIFPTKAARGLTGPLFGRVRGPMFSAWVNTALPVMKDALKEASTPSSGVLGAVVVEAPPSSGAKGSTLPGQAGAKAPEDVPGNETSLVSTLLFPYHPRTRIYPETLMRPIWPWRHRSRGNRTTEDFWENHALAHWNRRFMRGSAEVNAKVEAAMGPLVGIIGCMYSIVRRQGTDLLRFFCYPHSFWPDFLRGGFSLKMMASVQGARAVQEYLSSQGSEFWPEVPSTSRTEPFDPPFMATLAFLKGRSLKKFWLKKFDPLNPARVSKVLAWLYAQAEEY